MVEQKPLSKKELAIKEICGDVDQLIESMLTSGLALEETYKYGHAESMLAKPGILNRRIVEKVLGGKLLSRANSSREFNFRQILLGLIYNNNRQSKLFTQNKKEVEKYIDLKLQALMQAD